MNYWRSFRGRTESEYSGWQSAGGEKWKTAWEERKLTSLVGKKRKAAVMESELGVGKERRAFLSLL
jgi:hypothetical protein